MHFGSQSEATDQFPDLVRLKHRMQNISARRASKEENQIVNEQYSARSGVSQQSVDGAPADALELSARSDNHSDNAEIRNTAKIPVKGKPKK